MNRDPGARARSVTSQVTDRATNSGAVHAASAAQRRRSCPHWHSGVGGEHDAHLLFDPGRRHLVPALAEQWVEQSAVDRMLVEHCADDDLLPGDHELAVVGSLADWSSNVMDPSGVIGRVRWSSQSRPQLPSACGQGVRCSRGVMQDHFKDHHQGSSDLRERNPARRQ